MFKINIFNILNNIVALKNNIRKKKILLYFFIFLFFNLKLFLN